RTESEPAGERRSTNSALFKRPQAVLASARPERRPDATKCSSNKRVPDSRSESQLTAPGRPYRSRLRRCDVHASGSLHDAGHAVRHRVEREGLDAAWLLPVSDPGMKLVDK